MIDDKRGGFLPTRGRMSIERWYRYHVLQSWIEPRKKICQLWNWRPGRTTEYIPYWHWVQTNENCGRNPRGFHSVLSILQTFIKVNRIFRDMRRHKQDILPVVHTFFLLFLLNFSIGCCVAVDIWTHISQPQSRRCCGLRASAETAGIGKCIFAVVQKFQLPQPASARPSANSIVLLRGRVQKWGWWWWWWRRGCHFAFPKQCAVFSSSTS